MILDLVDQMPSDTSRNDAVKKKSIGPITNNQSLCELFQKLKFSPDGGCRPTVICYRQSLQVLTQRLACLALGHPACPFSISLGTSAV